MTENRIVLRLNTRHIIHSGTPATRPIHTITPRTVQAKPLVISTQYREYLMQAFCITKLMIINHFAPRHQVRTGTYRIITFKTVCPISFNLTTDKAIRMLFGIKVIQRILEREKTGTIAGKHQNKRRIPHKYIAIVCRIDKRSDKTRTGLRVMNISYCNLPCTPIHGQLVGMTRPNRSR